MPVRDPFDDLEQAFLKDDGMAAREHLAAGRPIYYGDARYPEALVRKWPDGTRQLVTIDIENEVTVLRQL